MNRNWAIAGVTLAVVLVGGTLLMDRGRVAQPVGSVRTGGAGATTATPVTDPVKLGRVTSPPPRTVAFIDPGAATADSAYTVTFAPYGAGPTPDTLVIAVTASEPVGTVALPFELAGRSVLVSTAGLPESMAITRGGTYAGTIVLAARGDVLVPMLTRAVAVR